MFVSIIMALKLKMKLFLYFCLCLSIKFTDAEQCTHNWFGSRCQYKCHCKGECRNGDCHGGCENGWFGFKCQYMDLAPSISVFHGSSDKLRHLVDNDNSTCIQLNGIKINLGNPYDITWMRLELQDPPQIDKLKMWFINHANIVINTYMKVKFIFNGRTVDVQLLLSENVRAILFESDNNEKFCSLHISDGRNVAPKQTANQSSTFDNVLTKASNAIDGNTDNIYTQWSCTHTGKGDTSPKWNLFLNPAYLIKRIVIYNRYDEKKNEPSVRLKNFQLKAFDEKNQETFKHVDDNPSALPEYNIVPTTRRLTKKISITAHDKTDGLYLTLCEVEVYAECPVGRWGLECDNTCGVCNGSCRLDDGACEKMCSSNPPLCSQKCEKGKYGNKCEHYCSQNCLQKEKQDHCDSVNGNCNYGCKAGYQKLLCQEECNGGTYGNNCSQNCSSNCKQSCHFETGKCHSGCTIGYQGDYCNNMCPGGRYGVGCKSNCSQHCKLSTCEAVNGYCSVGCIAGFEGAHCLKGCDRDRWGENCNNTCSSYCLHFNDIRYHDVCNKTTGICQRGCIPGYIPPSCLRECDDGYYGENCLESCSETCLNNTCNTISGHCNVCRPGYEGMYCKQEIINWATSFYNQSISPTSSQGDSNERTFDLGLGIWAALMTLIVVFVCVIFYVRRKRRKAKRIRQRKEHVYNEPKPLENETSLYTSLNQNVPINETSELNEINEYQNKENVYNVIEENI